MKIGEAAGASGISEQLLIRQGLRENRADCGSARTDSGYRDYDERDVHTLRFIGRARDLGFSID